MKSREIRKHLWGYYILRQYVDALLISIRSLKLVETSLFTMRAWGPTSCLLELRIWAVDILGLEKFLIKAKILVRAIEIWAGVNIINADSATWSALGRGRLGQSRVHILRGAHIGTMVLGARINRHARNPESKTTWRHKWHVTIHLRWISSWRDLLSLQLLFTLWILTKKFSHINPT